MRIKIQQNKLKNITREIVILKQINYLGYVIYPILFFSTLYFFRNNLQTTLLRLLLLNLLVVWGLCYISTMQNTQHNLTRAIVSLRNSLLLTAVIWHILFNKQALSASIIFEILIVLLLFFVYLFYSKLVKLNSVVENTVSLLCIFFSFNFYWLIKEFWLLNTDFILVVSILTILVCLLAWSATLKIRLKKELVFIFSILSIVTFFSVYWHEYYFYSAFKIYLSSGAILVTALTYSLIGIYYQESQDKLTKQMLIEYLLVSAIIIVSETLKVISN